MDSAFSPEEWRLGDLPALGYLRHRVPSRRSVASVDGMFNISP